MGYETIFLLFGNGIGCTARFIIYICSMKMRTILITILLLASCSKGVARKDPAVSWGFPKTVCEGGYGRIHLLEDGTLMLTYTISGDCFVRKSEDGGTSWGEPVLVMGAFDYEGISIRCVNPEFTQLKSGRIVFASNLRPQDGKSTIHPYAIAIATSEDGGLTWSERKTVYAPPLWNEDVKKGAWEPFMTELPDGRLQLYFTDNTPHYMSGDKRGNNISVIESRDGGESWSKETIVCHTPGGWDGMPVVAQKDGKLYLVVEHKDKRGSNNPMEIMVRSTGADMAWNGDTAVIRDEGYYCGAPYIIRTENYFVVSCQSAFGSDEPLEEKHSAPAVWYGKSPDKMKRAGEAIRIDQTKFSGVWNSLCPLDGDSFFLVTQHRGKIMIVKGTIE